MKKIELVLYLFLLSTISISAQNVRQKILIDDNWQFAFGNAENPAKDFGAGTEYFNYFTKANSIHNAGPYSLKFDASAWKTINLPHDWVVDLPFADSASHSHGYKTVGYKFPKTSVGWYRKTFNVEENDFGKHFSIQFDGIFRDATIWVNGFYVGNEPSGYATQVYDITDYLNYDGENLICVRVDATFEEGWFYEGAGIYRHVWLNKTAPVHVAPFGTFISSKLNETYSNAFLNIETTVENSGLDAANYSVRQTLSNSQGVEVARSSEVQKSLLSKEKIKTIQQIEVKNPTLWSLENPYLYTLTTDIYSGGKLVDSYKTTTGIRQIRFDANEGFFLNGKHVKLKGVNMHQDHAGVGTAIPDALQEYRIKCLKSFGCNAYRASHNPMTPEMLDVCDREGILVIEENRLMGINFAQIDLMRRMIERDRNHPSIILWSIGNEEWGLENNAQGMRVAASMREYCHRIDSTRLATVGNAGGVELIKSLDVVGYNYIFQNKVEELHKQYPMRIALGSEETSGCGTRGIYYTDTLSGRMAAHNRGEHNGTVNIIERGWKFYDERPYLAGVFYWTGFDYRGEPNPLKFPATGSQFGIVDYCGFYKDEAYYLKSWWTNEPVLHILPHWNLSGHEGENVEIWAYSNCDEVELFVNGKNLGRKKMPKNGHLVWNAIYNAGTLKAKGYKNGKKIIEQTIATAGKPAQMQITASKTNLVANNRDVAVLNVELQDAKGNFAADACNEIDINIEGEGRILGVGNGDSGYRASERPTDANARQYKVNAFNGLAQILIQSKKNAGEIKVTLSSNGIKNTIQIINVSN